MKSIVFAAALLLASSAAQAEIICTRYGGCWETGKRIFRTGGRMDQGMSIINHRGGEKDSGKPIRIRRVY